MDDELRIVLTDKPDDADHTAVGMGVHHFNVAQAGETNYRQLGCFLHGPDGEVVAGLIGATYWDWFYLDLLWVREDQRGKGLGRRLVTEAEAEARRRGAKGAYLDTFSFQAPAFYEKLGYQIFGELDDFPGPHRRYFYAKAL
jgi:GNAT superfamily N-acetyltransferase